MQPTTPRDRFRTLLLLVALVVGCRSVSVKGVIQTPEEKPIANASLMLLPEDMAGHSLAGSSEPNGCFDLYETIDRHQSRFLLVVDSPGYQPLRIAVEAHESLLLVTLEPITSPEPSDARPISSSERKIRYGVPCEPEVTGRSLTLH